MRNFHSGWGDPLERLICTEEWEERRRSREVFRVRIVNGRIMMTIVLPSERILPVAIPLEEASTLAQKLRIVADELERLKD